MVRGIKFEVPNKWFPVLNSILANIDVKQYFWFIADEDVIDNFDHHKYTGDEFDQVIKKEEYYVISINLQAYPTEDDISEIHSYQDFLRSKCGILILIDDNIYVYVYAKSSEVLFAIRKAAIANQYENIGDITDDNNPDNLEWL